MNCTYGMFEAELSTYVPGIELYTLERIISPWLVRTQWVSTRWEMLPSRNVDCVIKNMLVSLHGITVKHTRGTHRQPAHSKGTHTDVSRTDVISNAGPRIEIPQRRTIGGRPAFIRPRPTKGCLVRTAAIAQQRHKWAACARLVLRYDVVVCYIYLYWTIQCCLVLQTTTQRKPNPNAHRETHTHHQPQTTLKQPECGLP